MDKFVKSQKGLKKHTKNRAIAWILAVLMLFSALPTGSMTVHATDAESVTYWTDNAATAFESGDGTEGNPYIVATEAQLAYMAQVLSGEDAANYKSCHYKVADDVTELDMSAHEWTPIAAFSGTFDGNGVTIKNLGINSTGVTYTGFFGAIGNKSDKDEFAVIKNLNFDNVIITATHTGSFYVGVIAGKVYSATIDNCKVLSGNVTATGTGKLVYAGGLIGWAQCLSSPKTVYTLNIYDCYNNSDINAVITGGTGDTGVRAGGLVGYIYRQNANIVNSANTGDITVTNLSTNSKAKANAGGLVGGFANTGSYVAMGTILNCYNAGTISTTETSLNNNLGGIAGAMSSDGDGTASLENCYYAEGSVPTGTNVTEVENGTSTKLTTIQSTDFVNTLNDNVKNLSYSGLLNWTLNTSNYPIPAVEVAEVTAYTLTVTANTEFGSVVAKVKGADDTEYTEYTSGKLESGTRVQITCVPNADCVIKSITNGSTNVDLSTLTNNVYEFELTSDTTISVLFESNGVDSLSGTGTEADPFIIEDEADLLLMAKYCNENSGASGKYFKVKDGVTAITLTEEWTPIAAFQGSFDGNGVTIKGLKITGTDSNGYVGFFESIGNKSNKDELAEIKNLNFADVTITTESSKAFYVGVIAGRVYSAEIENCKVLSGSVTATGTGSLVYIGGLIGWAQFISSPQTVYTLNIYNCYNNSDITAIANGSGKTGVRAGGIAGYIYRQNVELINTANTGDVTVTNASTNTSAKAIAGGLIGTLSNSGNYGATGAISNCYNAGTVSATETSQTNTLGGFVGSISDNCSIENCYFVENSVPDSSNATISKKGTAVSSVTTEEFLNTLNDNAADINANRGQALATTWQKNTDNYPVPTNVAATIAYSLSVSAYNLGSVKTEVKAQGENSAYTDHVETNRLAEGTQVKLTCTPNEGCFIKDIKLNDVAVDISGLTNGVYEFTIAQNTTVEVTFAGCDLLVTVNDTLMGSVATTVKIPGTTEYVAYESGNLPFGTSVCLTWTVNHAKVAVESLSINDEPVTISNPTENKHIFELTGDVNVVVSFSAGDAASADIYVNPNATDGGNGSLEKPFRTLEEAKAKIAVLVAATPNTNITVHLMGGTYRLDAPLELGVTETSYERVSFVDYSGDSEKPVITSAKVIAPDSFKKVTGKEYYSYQLPETTKVSGAWPQFRDLLVDGELATLAKTEIYVFEKNGTASEETGKVLLDDILVDEELVNGITTSNIGNLEVAYKYKWSFRRFHFEEIGEAEDGLVPLRVRRGEAIYTGDYAALAGKEYWLQNHINFLDEPGEFYYEETTGTIYYYPYTDQNMSEVVVEYPTLDTLIEIGGENVKALVADAALEKAFIENNTELLATLELSGVANFTFDGITFTGTTFNWLTNRGLFGRQGCTYLKDPNMKNGYGEGNPGINVTCAAIYAEYADGIRVQNCTFTQLGGHAMLFNYGIDDLQVIGNSITDIGMVGVNVGVQQRRLLENGVQGNSSDVVISNNYISNVGYAVLNGAAIRVARGENMEITHNTIIHTPYSAIVAGWGFTMMERSVEPSPGLKNVEIAYNYIEDFMYALADGGAIYTNGSNSWADDTELINSVHHNYLRAGAWGNTMTGVYHDGASSNWHTHHNVIDDVVSRFGPIFFQDDVDGQNTHNITAANNYTTTSEITQDQKDKDVEGGVRNIKLENNTMFADRSELNAEALEIIQGAGVEAEYAHLAAPMESALQIADDTIRYVVDRSTGLAEVHVKLTNNSESTRTYTLSLLNEVSDGLEVVYPNGLTLVAGESGIATITLQAEDVASLTSSAAASVVGIRVTDNTGRAQDYPRTFTVRTSSAGGSGTTTTQRPESEVPEFDATLGEVNIAYGTPTIDGIMDDMYKNSCKIEQGPIVYPSSGNPTSDVKSTSYLVWDQTYLYCYTIIEDSTVMSRGMDVLSTKAVNQLWKNDAFEFWLKVLLSGEVKQTKFSIDAFGIQPYGDGKFDISYHESLPYATAFTNNGNVIENYAITAPTAGQMASTFEQPVNGYVVEMALPLTEAEGITNKCPWVGDKIIIKVQTNDLQSITNDSPNVVAFRTDEITCTLNGKVSSEPEVSPTPTPEVSPTPTPEVSPTPAPEVGPTPDPEDEDDNDSDSSNDDSNSEAEADITSTTTTPGTGDNSRYGFWLSMLVLACGAAISVLMMKRKNRF